MSKEVKPKINILKFLRYLPTLLSVRNVKKEKLEKFLAARQYMDEPLIPTEKDDGAKGPMEEGMWYIIFDSSGDGELDTAVRYFWVNAPFANITVNDLFLVSEHLENRRFSKIYGSSKIIKNAPNRAHIVGKADEFEYTFTGSFKKGYRLVFKDYKTNVEGDVIYKPHPKGVLFYNNGKNIVVPGLNIRYYDVFWCNLEGKIIVDGKEYDLKNARGIYEHSGGVFTTETVAEWNWINMQFPNGASHMFFIDMDYKEQGRVPINEGAVTLDDKFMHFLGDDMKLTPTKYKHNELFNEDFPVEWTLEANSKKGYKVKFLIKSTAELSFIGDVSDEKVVDYVLAIEGEVNGQKVEGKGTMERITH